MAARAASALAALSSLTPSAERKDDDTAVPLDWFRWLDDGLQLFIGPTAPPADSVFGRIGRTVAQVQGTPMAEVPSVSVDRGFGERLAAVQQVRGAPFRIGWLWVVGTASVVTANGASVRRRICQPLVTMPVRVQRSGVLGWALYAAGDAEVTPLVGDREVAAQMEATMEFGGGAIERFRDLSPALLQRLPKLSQYATGLAAAAGLPATALITDRSEPAALMRHDGLRIAVGLAVYSTEDQERVTRSGALRGWLEQPSTEPTAFHAVYAGADTSLPPNASGVEAPLPLTPNQREAVQAGRTAAVTVISGAPGTGKSHTLTAIVCDALARGESVLVTAKTDAAVDALIRLLERQPGIQPVVFGSNERRAALAQRLANGELRPAADSEVTAAYETLAQAIAVRDAARAAVVDALRPEWVLSPAGAGALAAARTVVPNLFTSPVDDATLARLAAGASSTGRGWWAGRKRTKADRALRALLGAPAEPPVATVLQAAQLARSRTSLDGTPEPVALCGALEAAESEVRRTLTAWLAVEIRSERRLGRAGAAAVAALATALRSGRFARRAQLIKLSDRTLTSALPVWMGTLGDVDDLLPPVPALFDLVLIDEASAIEQTLAASSLLRARRAVVVGDPQQLRHVSFVSDDTITTALDAANVTDGAERAQLDVRRNSLFDAAAGATPVRMLDEHFRSAPHLIQAVAHDLYGGRLHVATRTPVTQGLDCVHLTRVAGIRDKGGLVRAEIDQVIAELRRLRPFARSVGVITPFRAQADALEQSVLASFGADDLIAMDLRIGTVHGFQGNERDIMVCSLGLVDGDAGGWTFVKDPHLLAVMLTRARTQMELVVSCEPPAGTLLGDYLATADSPPGTPPPRGTLAPWAMRVMADLRLAGVQPAECYPTGRHVLDGATAVGGHPVALICGLHPDGIDAHIDRHLALLRGGWTVIDALESRWGDRLPELTLTIAPQLRPA